MRIRMIVACLLAVNAFHSSSRALAQAPATDSAKFSSWDPKAEVKYWVEPATTTSASKSAPNETGSTSLFPDRISERVGVVEQFDDEQFVAYDRQTAEEFAVPAERIIWIEPTTLPEREREALLQFHRGEYEASLRPLLDAVADRPPVWRQQFLTVAAAQAAMRNGRYKIALELVSQLDRRPLPPLVLGWLPIAWNSQSIDSGMQQAARDRIQDPSLATRLVAASWLVTAPERSQVASLLQQLATEDQPERIAQLARVLSWQFVNPPQVPSEATGWLRELDSLPMVLQTGPTILVSQKMVRSGQAELALPLILATEWVPIHPHPDTRKTP